ncbi:MAG: PIN domain-containing protein [Dehalococcoidia bacterium]
MSDGRFVDTNVLLRYFLRDHPEQFQAARLTIENITDPSDYLRVSPSTISEYVFVALGPLYKRTRAEIAESVAAILGGPFDVTERETVGQAVALYRDVHDDWDDCLLAAYALEQGDGSVVSFDRGLDRIPGLTRVEPTVPAANG